MGKWWLENVSQRRPLWQLQLRLRHPHSSTSSNPTTTKIKSMNRKAARPAPQTLRTSLPCGLSRVVVQEPYDPPNAQIRHRSQVALASYAPTDQAWWTKGTGPGMMGAWNAGNVWNARNAAGNPFGRMFDAAPGLATGVPAVFVNGRLIEFVAIHTPAQGLTNQANQLNQPPSLSHTNSSGSDSGMDTMTGIRHPHTHALQRPGPLAHERRSLHAFPLFAETKRTREARASHISRKQQQQQQTVTAEGVGLLRRARLSLRPSGHSPYDRNTPPRISCPVEAKGAKSGCSATA